MFVTHPSVLHATLEGLMSALSFFLALVHLLLGLCHEDQSPVIPKLHRVAADTASCSDPPPVPTTYDATCVLS